MKLGDEMAGRSTFGTVVAKARPLYLFSLRLAESGAVSLSAKRLTQPPLTRSIPVWFCRLCLDSTDHRRIPQPDQSRSVRGRYRTCKVPPNGPRQQRNVAQQPSRMQILTSINSNFSPAIRRSPIWPSIVLQEPRKVFPRIQSLERCGLYSWVQLRWSGLRGSTSGLCYGCHS